MFKPAVENKVVRECRDREVEEVRTESRDQEKGERLSSDGISGECRCELSRVRCQWLGVGVGIRRNVLDRFGTIGGEGVEEGVVAGGSSREDSSPSSIEDLLVKETESDVHDGGGGWDRKGGVGSII